MKFHQNISKEIAEDKYFRPGETAEILFSRVAEEISSVEKISVKEKIFSNFYKILSEGKFIPGGRILANARPDSLMKQYNNCYTIDIKDSMEEITKSIGEYMKILKTGGGVGFDVSKLRPKGTPLSVGGVSSGPMSFLEVFDSASKTIRSGNRRGASIAIMRCDHPDIREFITYKQGDKNKKLTQFNISVGITDAFMEAVENDSNWDLVWEGKVFETVKAKEIYDLMVENAFWNNEPGVLFLDTVERYNNGWWAFKVDRTNPCLTGSTRIETSKGIKTIKEVVKAYEAGEKIKVLSYDLNENEKKYCEVSFGLLTKENTEVIELEIEESDRVYHISCTPDHQIYTRNRGYVEAKNLTSEDNIVVGEYLWED